ncbi:MAG: DUF3987 domain-containing protein, partial [Alteraurantiacibacter sp.]
GQARGIQDDLVRKKLSKMEADGFMARFLFVNLKPAVGEDFFENENAEQAYAELIRRIYRCTAADGQCVVKMSPEAAAIGADLRRMRMTLQRLPTVNQGLSEHMSKWDDLWARFALILHIIKFHSDTEENQREMPLADQVANLSRDDAQVKIKQGDVIRPARTISKETAEQARDLLVKFFLPEAVRIYTEVLSTDDQMQHARWLAGHILANGVKKISVYEIGRIYRPLAKDHRALGEAMNALELMGWVWADGGKAAVGDFRKMKWNVSSRVHDIFADRVAVKKARRSKAVADIRVAKKAANRLRLGC